MIIKNRVDQLLDRLPSLIELSLCEDSIAVHEKTLAELKAHRATIKRELERTDAHEDQG